MKKVIFELLVLAVIVFTGNEYILKPLVESSSSGQNNIVEHKMVNKNALDDAFIR